MIVRYILFFVFLNHEDISCGHGTHMNESWYTYEWVMANTWWSVSCHTYDTGTANTWLSSHATCMNESLNTWLTQSRDTLLHVCAMTHSYVYHDSFIGRGHVKRMIASRCVHVAMPHTWMSHGTQMIASRHTYACVMSNTTCRCSHVPHINETLHT